MDYQASMLAFFTISVSILLYSRSKSSKKALPPSPFGLPILGHLHLLSKIPHQSLVALSNKYGPYMLLNLGTKPTLIVSSSRAAREVLKTHDLVFASRPKMLIGDILTYNGHDLVLAPYGEHWRNTRKICTLELFTTKQAMSFRPIREAEMSVLLQELKSVPSNQAVNIRDKLSDFNFYVISKMIMGKSYPKEEARIFRDLLAERDKLCSVNGIIRGLANFIPFFVRFDTGMKLLKLNHEKIDELVEKQILEHQENYQSYQKDFLSVMMSLCDKGELDRSTMKALVMNIIGAATESSASTSEWAMAQLVKNSHTMAKLRQEIEETVGRGNRVDESHLGKLEYLQAVVKETLRLHPAAPLLLPHESIEECQLEHKYVIPAKTQLFVNVYAIGRDPEVWENASEFVPERFLGSEVDVAGHNFELLPFGSGRRSCPGINLALRTLHLTLASLVHEFDWITEAGVDVDLTEGLGFTLHPATPLKLVPVERAYI